MFLESLDGVDSKRDGILVIGATNKPWEIDLALRRSRRLNKKITTPNVAK